MRSKFPCCVCGTKSSNSGFVSPGSREKCLCGPCYAKLVRASLQSFGVGVDVETQTKPSDLSFVNLLGRGVLWPEYVNRKPLTYKYWCHIQLYFMFIKHDVVCICTFKKRHMTITIYTYAIHGPS